MQILAAVLIALFYLVGPRVQRLPIPPAYAGLFAGSVSVVLALAALYRGGRLGRRTFAVAPKPLAWAAVAGVGMGGFSKLGLLLNTCLHAMPQGTLVPQGTLSPQARFALSLVVSLLLAPLAEELIFRGLLFHALAGRLPYVWAIVLSALLFALPHTPLAVPLAFVLGAVNAYLYWYTGSLAYPILLHFLTNGMSLFSTPLYQLMQARPLAGHLLCLGVVLGGGAVVLGALRGFLRAAG